MNTILTQQYNGTPVPLTQRLEMVDEESAWEGTPMNITTGYHRRTFSNKTEEERFIVTDNAGLVFDDIYLRKGERAKNLDDLDDLMELVEDKIVRIEETRYGKAILTPVDDLEILTNDLDRVEGDNTSGDVEDPGDEIGGVNNPMYDEEGAYILLPSLFPERDVMTVDGRTVTVQISLDANEMIEKTMYDLQQREYDLQLLLETSPKIIYRTVRKAKALDVGYMFGDGIDKHSLLETKTMGIDLPSDTITERVLDKAEEDTSVVKVVLDHGTFYCASDFEAEMLRDNLLDEHLKMSREEFGNLDVDPEILEDNASMSGRFEPN